MNQEYLMLVMNLTCRILSDYSDICSEKEHISETETLQDMRLLKELCMNCFGFLSL